MFAFMLMQLFAQEAGGGGGGGGAQKTPNPMDGPGLMLLMFGIFFLAYLFLLRPAQKRQERERQMMLTSLEKNDKVLTIGGIYGFVVSVHDTLDEVTIKVDDNTRMKVTKGSISRNITREEKVAEEKKAAGK